MVPALLLVTALSGSAWAQGRVATVDLRKLFDNYWKTKQADAGLKDRAAELDKEDKNLRDDLKKANDDYQKLLSSVNDQAVSAEERDRRKKSAETKLKELKDSEDAIVQYERQAQTTLVEQRRRVRENILSEIRATVNAKAKAGDYALVVDTAAESVNNTPVFLYFSGENDLTDAILSQLNAGAPIETAKPAEKKEEKTDGKKKDEKK